MCYTFQHGVKENRRLLIELLIGTGNVSKFRRYKRLVEDHPRQAFTVVSVHEVGGPLSVAEDGATARENAVQKASAYAQAYGLVTLAIDEALYIHGLEEHDQPGTYVRRQHGRTLSDEEVLAYFINKVKRIPPRGRSVTWIYALGLAHPDGWVTVNDVRLDGGIGVEPVMPILPGYPLSSILVHKATGKVHRELTDFEEMQRLDGVRQCLYELLDSATAT